MAVVWAVAAVGEAANRDYTRAAAVTASSRRTWLRWKARYGMGQRIAMLSRQQNAGKNGRGEGSQAAPEPS